jgi:hypothetical protein
MVTCKGNRNDIPFIIMQQNQYWKIIYEVSLIRIIKNNSTRITQWGVMKRIIFFILLLLIMSGCSQKIPDYVFNDYCQLPCWNGITPGITSQDEAITVAKSWKFTDQVSGPFIDSHGNSRIIIHFIKTENQVWVYFNNSHVAYMDISIKNIKFRQYQKYLGNPTFVGYVKGNFGDVGGEHIFYVYPDKNIIVHITPIPIHGFQVGLIITGSDILYDVLTDESEGGIEKLDIWSAEK